MGWGLFRRKKFSTCGENGKKNSPLVAKDYVRWERVQKYLKDIFESSAAAGEAKYNSRLREDMRLAKEADYKPEFISESVFYMLAMKAKNEAAMKFQLWISYDVVPQINRRGYYLDPRLGLEASPDGIWTLASGERMNIAQIKRRVEELGLEEGLSIKESVREINQREHYLAIREKYPYSYDEVDRNYGDVEYYRCFIKEGEDGSIYSKAHGIDEYFSEAFIDLIKRVGEEEAV